ncbi:hypothetical protein DSECCO2_576460 [anaerobic digester metagenome]
MGLLGKPAELDGALLYRLITENRLLIPLQGCTDMLKHHQMTVKLLKACKGLLLIHTSLHR